MNLAETRFIVVRHGQTEWNMHGRWQGWEDSPLTDLGRAQAAQVAECLREYKIDAVYSSVSGRALATSEVIANEHGLPVQATEELRERFAGAFEGLTTDEINERYPGKLFDPEKGNRKVWKPVGGETLEDVAARIRPFLLGTARKHAGQTVALVTHSIVVRVIDYLATSDEWEIAWERPPANCCVFEVAVDAHDQIRVITHHHEGYCDLAKTPAENQ